MWFPRLVRSGEYLYPTHPRTDALRPDSISPGVRLGAPSAGGRTLRPTWRRGRPWASLHLPTACPRDREEPAVSRRGLFWGAGRRFDEVSPGWPCSSARRPRIETPGLNTRFQVRHRCDMRWFHGSRCDTSYPLARRGWGLRLVPAGSWRENWRSSLKGSGRRPTLTHCPTCRIHHTDSPQPESSRRVQCPRTHHHIR